MWIIINSQGFHLNRASLYSYNLLDIESETGSQLLPTPFTYSQKHTPDIADIDLTPICLQENKDLVMDNLCSLPAYLQPI